MRVSSFQSWRQKKCDVFFRFFLHQQRKSAIGTGLRIAIMKRQQIRLRSLIPPLPDLHQWRGGINARDAGVVDLAWGMMRTHGGGYNKPR